ncbi:MAG: SemiSWEET transporter [Clostridia bacterium]|jgi:MtN3 and saliva related transmembrane protein|nr:SemiSWEET transporter [Clostridia bacterium]
MFSFAAAILTTLSFVPQAVQVIKTKDTKSISLVMYIMFTLGVLCWLIYGIGIGDIALISANSITFIFALIILSYKIINVKSGKDK